MCCGSITLPHTVCHPLQVDLVSGVQLREVEAVVRGINSAAAIHHTTRSALSDLGVLLGRRAYRMRRMGAPQADSEGVQAGMQPQGPVPAPGNASAGTCAAGEGATGPDPLQWLGGAADGAQCATCDMHQAAGTHSTPGQQQDHIHAGDGQQPHHHHHQHEVQQGSSACSVHDSSVHTITLRVPSGAGLDLGRFRAWVEELLWDRESSTAGSADAKGSAPEAAHPNAAAAAGAAEEAAAAEAALAGEVPGASPAAQSSEGAAAAVSSEHGTQAQPRPDVLRMKGLLHVAGSAQVHLFQAVYETYDVAPGPEWAELLQRQRAQGGVQYSGRETRIVVIGRYLDGAAMQQQLGACCIDPQSMGLHTSPAVNAGAA